MNRTDLVEKLMNKKVKDYSFTVLFFVIFAFFAIFVIKPNLSTAFSLQKELLELRALDKNYEQGILNIVNFQSLLETKREDFFLLDDAIPPHPFISQLIGDIDRLSSSSGIVVKKINIQDINLKETVVDKKLRQISLNLELEADFPKTHEFFKAIINQRRIKAVKKIAITKSSKEASGSSTLKIQFDVDSYYL
ncbi:MAG: type 4a pilus biogenesis protein PilO [bacterium]|nr:type 4a pilus biogenesis protein PilO [bacterium]